MKIQIGKISPNPVTGRMEYNKLPGMDIPNLTEEAELKGGASLKAQAVIFDHFQAAGAMPSSDDFETLVDILLHVANDYIITEIDCYGEGIVVFATEEASADSMELEGWRALQSL